MKGRKGTAFKNNFEKQVKSERNQLKEVNQKF